MPQNLSEPSHTPVESAFYRSLEIAVKSCDNMLKIVGRHLSQPVVQREIVLLGIEYADAVIQGAAYIEEKYEDPMMGRIVEKYDNVLQFLFCEIISLQRKSDRGFLLAEN